MMVYRDSLATIVIVLVVTVAGWGVYPKYVVVRIYNIAIILQLIEHVKCNSKEDNTV